MQATYQNLSESILSNLHDVRREGLTTDENKEGVIAEYTLSLKEKINAIGNINSKEATIEM